jgi:hypothetical protein
MQVKHLDRRTEEDVACSDLPRYLRAALQHTHHANGSFGARGGPTSRGLAPRLTDPAEETEPVNDDARRRKMERKRREQSSDYG